MGSTLSADGSVGQRADPSIVSQIHEAIDRAQIFPCPNELDGAPCGAQGVKDSACMFCTCPACLREFCYWCGRPSKDHVCPANCAPRWLSEAKLSNGFEFSENGRAATQEYYVWRARWLLRRVCDKVGRREFEAAVRHSPGILEDLFADDGSGITGGDETPLAGVAVTVEDVLRYEHVTVVEKLSGAHGCDPFPEEPRASCALM